MTQAHEIAQKSLADRIREAVETDKVQLPPLPELTVRLQQLLANPDDVQMKPVLDLVSNDPAVAASLLRIANSATFGGLQRVTNLHQAIARLGFEQVGSIVTALTMKGYFTNDGQKRELLSRLWDHSLTSAFAARRLAQRVGVDATEAFLAGLLHDCGRLLVLKALEHLEQHGGQARTPPALVEELMETLHTTLGHRTLTAWRLPDGVARVALHHEEPAGDGTEDVLLMCVQAADLITKKLGFHPQPAPDLPLLQEPAIETLGLGDVELATLMIDLEDELGEVKKLFA
jgi:HD-like signal output (HDOD) protein